MRSNIKVEVLEEEEEEEVGFDANKEETDLLVFSETETEIWCGTKKKKKKMVGGFGCFWLSVVSNIEVVVCFGFVRNL